MDGCMDHDSAACQLHQSDKERLPRLPPAVNDSSPMTCPAGSPRSAAAASVAGRRRRRRGVVHGRIAAAAAAATGRALRHAALLLLRLRLVLETGRTAALDDGDGVGEGEQGGGGREQGHADDEEDARVGRLPQLLHRHAGQGRRRHGSDHAGHGRRRHGSDHAAQGCHRHR